MEKKLNIRLPKGDSYGVKLLVIGLILIIFIPPIAMVRGLINERSARKYSAEEEVISSWGGRSKIAGPVLVLPYQEEIITKNDDGKTERSWIKRNFLVFPEVLDIQVDAPVEERSRGIYHIPVFTADIALKGMFVLENALKDLPANTKVDWDGARLGVNLGSLKGLSSVSPLSWKEREYGFEPGDLPLSVYPSHIVTPVDIKRADSPRGYNFSLDLVQKGGDSFEFIPLAKETSISIRSDWSAPSFYGDYLPVKREFGEEGFSAVWKISYLSRDIPSHLVEGVPNTEDLRRTAFGVRLFEPVSTYAKNERSVKYAYLFLLVPFIIFFLFEVIRKMKIHPVQYLLAGAADVVFYLLLLSTSEHLHFFAAYCIAAFSVTLLLTLYSVQVLGGWKPGLLMGSFLAAGYVYLYVVLQSEDYALLLGSVGLFMVLAAVMFVTRKVTWYKHPNQQETDSKELTR